MRQQTGARAGLIVLFGGILLGMLAVTTYAASDRGIWEAGAELMAYPWFWATLCDAYFGFLTFYVWVAFRERTWWSRGVWFVLIMLLGNIAMSVYVLYRILTLRPGEGWRELLVGSEQPTR